MKKVIFLCHGNICRSPIAEFVFKDIVRDHGKEKEYEIASKALSSEEIGNDIYPSSKECLKRNNIPFTSFKASKFTLNDYNYYDHIYIMDESNLRLIKRICEDKECKIELLNGYIEDPWYTGNFDKVFNQIKEGCIRVYKELEND